MAPSSAGQPSAGQQAPGPELSDSDVVNDAARIVSIPRVEPGDSFILHAPLELLARKALLAHVGPDARDPVRDRIATIAREYEAWGSPFDRRPVHGDAVSSNACGVLLDAIDSGDAEAADDAITWITGRIGLDEVVRTLADPVLRSLAAAAHGPILLYLLQRTAARSLPAAAMARTTIHELVRHPARRLRWFDGVPQPGGEAETVSDAETELAWRLAAPVLSERPESTSIFPTMETTERTGLARETLGGLVGALTVPQARRSLIRSAAMSMLQDEPDHAPYGWTHCLTMPQAALGVAYLAPDQRVAVSVAATYVLAFRASLGAVELDAGFVPEPVVLASEEIIAAAPSAAAGSGWHTQPSERATLWRTLAANAGAHRDAHLAKYTLACLDASRDDPSHEHLYLAAASFLGAWWHDHDAAAD